MRLAILAALIVMEACLLICGGWDDDEQFAVQCMQQPLLAEALERIYNSAAVVAAERGDDEPDLDDVELSWARYCEPCDPAPVADLSPAAP